MSRGTRPAYIPEGMGHKPDRVDDRRQRMLNTVAGTTAVCASGEVPVLYVQTLGGFSLRRGDVLVPTESWRNERLWPLFTGLLSAANHRLSRDQLIELLWPDKDLADPANSLREVLSKLRRRLAPAGVAVAATPAYIRNEGPFLALVPDTVAIDADMFLSAAQQALATRNLTICQEAIDSYGGDYLPQGTSGTLPRHAALIQGRRNVLRRTASDLLALTAELCEETDARRAAQYLQRALSLNPTAEDKARRLMTVLGRLGELAAVQDVFGTLSRTLAQQGVPPSQETVIVRDRMLEAGAHCDDRTGVVRGPCRPVDVPGRDRRRVTRLRP